MKGGPELTGGRAVWKRALEGWNMRESQQVLEWQAEARAEAWKAGQTDALLRVLRLQFGSPLPDELVAEVKALTEEADLSRWFEAAVKSRTLEQFQAQVNGRP
jgi:hypothetical protein